MAGKPIDCIFCEDARGVRYEVLLTERYGGISARLSDGSAVLQIGPRAFRIIWNNLDITCPES